MSENWFKNWIGKVKQNEPKIGEGGERDVYIHPHDDKKILGIFHYRNDDPASVNWYSQKTTFYLAKIAHILFPEHIPRMHQVTTEPGTVTREYVSGQHSDKSHTNDAEAIRKLLEDAGFALDPGTERNYKQDVNGTIKYIDTVYIRKNFYQDLPRIETVVRQQLQGPQLREALHYVERLKDLHKQRERNFQDNTDSAKDE